MAYTPTVWLEHSMDAAAKVIALNNTESQWTAGCDFLDNIDHSERYYSKSYMNDTYFTEDTDGHNSGLIAETLDGYTAAQLLASAAPSGVIVYYQSLTPPSGWYLCNGANGTPNLNGRFIIGSGDSYNPGNYGGSHTITITATATVGAHALTTTEMPAHIHSVRDYFAYAPAYGYGDITGSGSPNIIGYPSLDDNTATTGSGSTHTHTASFAGSSQEKRPPFYTLAAVMKG